MPSIQVDQFVREATAGTFENAAAMLRNNPAVAAANFLAACVAGEPNLVEAELLRDPSLASQPAGFWNAEPLLYAANSQFLRHDPARAARIVQAARLLLENGADPNCNVTCDEGHGPYQLSALYAASGRANHAGLTQLLLEAGANPNDNESLYHSTEFGNPACTRLLLEHGAKIEASNALHRQLDFEDLPGLTVFFAFGASPNLPDHRGNPLIHHAINRGRSAEILSLLADRGADLKARDIHGLTPFQAASRLGHVDAIRFLTERGFAEEHPAKDRFVAACAVGDADRARQFAAPLSEMDSVVLAELAWRANTRGVALLLEHGVAVSAPGHNGETALHNAAWMGHLPTVDAILPYHPPLEVRDRCYDATPLGWAIHGMTNSKDHSGKHLRHDANHPAVIRALLAAGAQIAEDQRQELRDKSIIP